MTERTGEHPNTERANTHPNTGEPKLAAFVSWLVLGASFGLSASTWIAIALLAGFTDRLNVLGLWTVDLAWLMPIAIDGYVVVALLLWTAPVPEVIATFARKNTYAAASVGVIAQSAFHCATIAAATHSVWQSGMAAVAGALPPLAAALSVHMRALIRRKVGKVSGGSITVRRVVVPSGLTIADQITTPNGRTDAEANTATDRTPIAGQDARTDAEANTPNTPEPIAPIMAGPNTDSIADAEQRPNEESNVRQFATARRVPNGKPNGANTDTTKNLKAIKRRYPNWRTDMPSARTIAALLGVSASTGYSYQQKLIAERDAPNTQPATDSDADDKEREAVAVS